MINALVAAWGKFRWSDRVRKRYCPAPRESPQLVKIVRNHADLIELGRLFRHRCRAMFVRQLIDSLSRCAECLNFGSKRPFINLMAACIRESATVFDQAQAADFKTRAVRRCPGRQAEAFEYLITASCRKTTPMATRPCRPRVGRCWPGCTVRI